MQYPTYLDISEEWDEAWAYFLTNAGGATPLTVTVAALMNLLRPTGKIAGGWDKFYFPVVIKFYSIPDCSRGAVCRRVWCRSCWKGGRDYNKSPWYLFHTRKQTLIQFSENPSKIYRRQVPQVQIPYALTHLHRYLRMEIIGAELTYGCQCVGPFLRQTLTTSEHPCQ